MAPSIRTMLVPIDFSPLSVCAFRFALQLAERTRVGIRLLHVVAHRSPCRMGRPSVMDELYLVQRVEETTRRLTDLARTHANPAVPVQPVVWVGNPAESILETIRKNQVDLVVMGASQVNWLPRLRGGTTAEKVIQHAACPVITIRCATEMGRLRQILFAFDPEADQTRVVAALKKLQRMLGARLHVLLFNGTHSCTSRGGADDRLHRFAQTHQLEEYDAYGYADLHRKEGLFEFARAVDAGIVALAAHSQHRRLRVFPARSEYNLIHHAPTPVWTFNPAMAAV